MKNYKVYKLNEEHKKETIFGYHYIVIEDQYLEGIHRHVDVAKDSEFPTLVHHEYYEYGYRCISWSNCCKELVSSDYDREEFNNEYFMGLYTLIDICDTWKEVQEKHRS